MHQLILLAVPLLQDVATSPGIGAQLLEALFDALAYIMPVVVGILTVPAFGGLKTLVAWLDELPASVQQVLVAAMAALLTVIAKWINAELPIDVMLFTEVEVSAWISAVAAFGIHAGQKRVRLAE